MRLIFITGKGGVGKSAVTAALGTLLALSNKKTGIVELNETRMGDFFNAKPPSYDGTSVQKNLTLFNLEAKECFEEYVSRILPKKFLMLLKNRWVEHFIHAVPGLNEILLLGKIRSLLQEEGFDTLLIDAPATGHTVSLCDAPRIAMAALKHGSFKTMVLQIWEMLHDPQQTSFLLVTQPEESIVQETIELFSYLQDPLKLHWQGLIVNGVLHRDASMPENLPNKVPPEAEPLLEILQRENIEFEKQKRSIQELEKAIPLQKTTLPWQGFLPEENLLRKNLAEELKLWVSKNF